MIPESLAATQGSSVFGFEALSIYFQEWPFLKILLKQRDYDVIYLTRHISRQVISGFVANQSGIWNTKGSVEHLPKYSMNFDEFQRHVEWKKIEVEKDCAKLAAEGFDF